MRLSKSKHPKFPSIVHVIPYIEVFTAKGDGKTDVSTDNFKFSQEYSKRFEG